MINLFAFLAYGPSFPMVRWKLLIFYCTTSASHILGWWVSVRGEYVMAVCKYIVLWGNVWLMNIRLKAKPTGCISLLLLKVNKKATWFNIFIRWMNRCQHYLYNQTTTEGFWFNPGTLWSGPPHWSSGQCIWPLTMRSQVRFLALPQF